MVPAAAIVDARNLFHQAENVLGFGAYPSVQGVMNGLALYGFDVRAVHVGVALARERDREALSYSHNVNAAYAEQIEAHPCGVTLRGELHLKDGRAEEKMVDVACAVDLCRLAAHIHQGGSPYQALVVLSQDIDLQPAYGYAAELDVSVHIAASSTVQYRPEPHLLLTEVPLALMCRESLERDSDLDTSVVGHELRARLAHLLYDQADQELAWRSIRREARRGGILLQHESGVLGVAAEEVVGGFTKGKTVRLYADGVDFGAGGSKFPVARCVPAPGLSGTQLRVASVSRRRTAFQLEARLTDTDEVIRIATSLGGMLPGTNILVQEQPGESGFRYIGFLEKPSVKDRTGQPVDPSMPVVLQIKHQLNQAHQAIAMDLDGGQVLLLGRPGTAFAPHQRYVAVRVGATTSGAARTVAMPISSSLPPSPVKI